MDSREINKMEQAGLNVLEIGREGEIVHQTAIKDENKYCNSCAYLRFYPDPDPDDWFEDDNQKAYCKKCEKDIEGDLRPNECLRVNVPAFCPIRD